MRRERSPFGAWRLTSQPCAIASRLSARGPLSKACACCTKWRQISLPRESALLQRSAQRWRRTSSYGRPDLKSLRLARVQAFPVPYRNRQRGPNICLIYGRSFEQDVRRHEAMFKSCEEDRARRKAEAERRRREHVPFVVTRGLDRPPLIGTAEQVLGWLFIALYPGARADRRHPVNSGCCLRAV